MGGGVSLVNTTDAQSQELAADSSVVAAAGESGARVTPVAASAAAMPHDAWYYLPIKRLIDLVVSILVIVIGLIPCAILAIVIAVQSKGAPFYTERRLGQYGKHFGLIKFRSMVKDANNVEKYLNPAQLEQFNRERKVDNDPRITPIGHFIRKSSLDEIPQFLNVLVGQMSIVGPRPIVDHELIEYGNRAAEFLSRKPGITGWWQVEARNEADYDTGTRQELELYYVHHACLSLDAKIFFKTFKAMRRGK